MRGMCAAVLSFEALVLALSIPVMIAVEDVDPALAVPLGAGLAVLCLLVAGSLRRPQAYVVGHVLQVALFALGLLVPIMFFIGAMFAALWVGAFLIGRRIEEDKARWAAEGGAEGPDEPLPQG